MDGGSRPDPTLKSSAGKDEQFQANSHLQSGGADVTFTPCHMARSKNFANLNQAISSSNWRRNGVKKPRKRGASTESLETMLTGQGSMTLRRVNQGLSMSGQKPLGLTNHVSLTAKVMSASELILAGTPMSLALILI